MFLFLNICIGLLPRHITYATKPVDLYMLSNVLAQNMLLVDTVRHCVWLREGGGGSIQVAAAESKLFVFTPSCFISRELSF